MMAIKKLHFGRSSRMIPLSKYKSKDDTVNTSSSGHRSRKCKEFSVKDAVRKSAAELMVLSLLCERTMYTYELNQLIRERSNGVLAFTTLYQATYKLKDLGYIEESEKVLSEDNRVRVYFSITQAGREALPIMMDEFHSTVSAIKNILNPEG